MDKPANNIDKQQFLADTTVENTKSLVIARSVQLLILAPVSSERQIVGRHFKIHHCFASWTGSILFIVKQAITVID